MTSERADDIPKSLLGKVLYARRNQGIAFPISWFWITAYSSARVHFYRFYTEDPGPLPTDYLDLVLGGEDVGI